MDTKAKLMAVNYLMSIDGEFPALQLADKIARESITLGEMSGDELEKVRDAIAYSIAINSMQPMDVVPIGRIGRIELRKRYLDAYLGCLRAVDYEATKIITKLQNG